MSEHAPGMIDVVAHYAEEFHPIVKLDVFGVDMSISKVVITMWLAVILIAVFIILAGRKTKLVPKPLQSMGEYVYLFIKDTIVLDMIGKEGLPWVPFLTTIFLFIIVNNFLGLIPGLATPTSSIYLTSVLALMVFFSVHITGAIKHGPLKYFRAVVLPEGAPLWLAPLFIPIEIISALAKPFSLMVRLFANMFAGHAVLLVFIGLILLYQSFLIAPIPLIISVIVGLLEIFFKFLQAYIFTVLSAMYISDAIHGGH